MQAGSAEYRVMTVEYGRSSFFGKCFLGENNRPRSSRMMNRLFQMARKPVKKALPFRLGSLHPRHDICGQPPWRCPGRPAPGEDETDNPMSKIPATAASGKNPTALLDDDDLLDLMRRDDVNAYRELVSRHINRGYAVALRILKNQADAEDVTQDAFVKAWLIRHDWERGRAKFSTWLYRVVVNRCIDLTRAPKSAGLDDVDEPADDADDAVTGIHRRQIYGRLGDALDQLPPQQKAAVILSYYEELSNQEVAEVMGASVSAVESLLKRARKGLREVLRHSEKDVRGALSE